MRALLLMPLLLGLSCGRDGATEPAADGGGASVDTAAPDGSAGEDSGSTGGQDAAPAPVDCSTGFGPGESLGNVGHPDLTELSGLEVSRRHAGVLYGHNDSGDGPRFFAFDVDGTPRGTFSLEGAAARDWEDMAIGPGPDGSDWLYFGDHGDNAARRGSGGRQSIAIYRVAEPASLPEAGGHVVLDTWERIVLTYPDRPRDAESLLIDPDTGDLFLITKDDDGMSNVFHVASPLPVDDPTEMAAVAAMTFGGDAIAGSVHATGAALSADGRTLMVRTYSAVALYRREPDEPIAALLAEPPDGLLPTLFEIQGESVAVTPDGGGYYTVSEGRSPEVHFFEAIPACGSGS